MCRKCCCKKKVGDEAEPEVLYVPRGERKCTDCLFCILFLVFWLGMIIIAGVAVPGGDPERLLYGVDHLGKVCGGDDRAGKKHIYYPRITEDIINFAASGETNPLKIKLFGVCLESCPSVGQVVCTETGQSSLDSLVSSTGKTELQVMIDSSDYSFWASYPTDVSAVKKGCWIVPLKTADYFFRCLWQREKNSTVTVTCESPESLKGQPLNDDTPANITNACVSKRRHEETETVGAGQEDPLLDQMFDSVEQMGRYVSDAQKAMVPIFICGALIGILMGFVWLVIVQFLAGCMVWLTIWLLMLTLIAGTLYAYFKAGILNQDVVDSVTDSFNDAAGTSAEVEAPAELNTAENNIKDRWKWFAYFMTGVTVIILLLVIYLRKKINRAIGMIKEAARTVKSMPVMLLFPLISVILTIILMVYWVIVAGFIYSNGDISATDVVLSATEAVNDAAAQNLLCTKDANGVVNASSCVGLEAAYDFDAESINNYLLLYHFFGLLWTNNFINGFFTMAIAGAVCIRYFSTSKKNKTKMPVLEALRTTFWKHLGSVAFGSLVIALVQLIRAILAYLDKKSKRIQDANVLVKYLFKCLACCLWCFEKCIKYVATNAYIIVAMKGKSFCPAAFEAVRLLLKNLAQVGVLNVISAFLFVMGKLLICGACGFFAFLWIDNDSTYSEGEQELYAFWVPVLLTVILAYGIGSAFMDVLGLAIDTILICYCVDVSRKNAGTAEKPLFANKKLLKAMNEGSKVSHEDTPKGDDDDTGSGNDLAVDAGAGAGAGSGGGKMI